LKELRGLIDDNLADAALKGNTPMVQRLLSGGANVNVRDKERLTGMII